MASPEPYESDVDGTHIWGWMTEPELLWLQSVARKMDSVAEVGSLHGRSAFALLSACPGPVYCIDPWDDAGDLCYGSFLGSCGHFPNLVPLRDRSPGVLERHPITVDMTFIDGAHAYEAVLADIAAWLPRTRKLICGHDYCNEDAGYPGVAQAVNQVFGKERVSVAEGTSIWAVDLTADRCVAADLPEGPTTFTDEYGVTSTLEIAW